MANLMLIQCGIASHAEGLTFQYKWKFYQELNETMVQFPEGMAVSTQGQHYAQWKEGHADQRHYFKLSPGCLQFVNWTMSSCLA